jgi:hypothetical protein
MADGQAYTEGQLKLLKDIKRYSEEFQLSLAQQVELEKRVLDTRIKSTDELEQAILRADEYTATQKAILSVEANKTKITKELRDLSYDIIKQTKDIADNNVNIYTVSQDQAELQIQQIQSQKLQIQQLQSLTDLSDRQKTSLKEALEQLDGQEAAYKSINALYEAQPDIAEKMKSSYDAASDGVKTLGTGIDTLFAKLPGGGMLQSALGLDSATDKLQGGVNAGFQAMNVSIAQGGGLMGGLRAGMSAFNATVMANPLLLVVGAATALFGLLSESEKKAQDFSATTGMSVAQSKALVKETENRINLGQTELTTSKDILAVQEQMIQKFGAAGKLSTEVAASVAETSKLMGYSAEAATGVQEAFELQGASAADAAKLQEDVALETFKTGVNTGQVMDDISENSKLASKYIKGGSKELAKAAVEAAKMGMNLESMVGVADGLLDIENSLTKQYEFQALTGKQINLDKARELALDGDIAGASKEVMKQVGSIEEFNKMNRLEKEALAEATGMEVGELQKSLTLQSKLGDLSEEQAAAAASLNLSAEEMAKLSPEQLKAKLAEQQTADQVKASFEETIQKLKNAFLPLAEALVPVFNVIATVVGGIGDAISGISKGLGMAMDYLGPIGTLLKVIVGVGVLLLVGAKLYARYKQKQLDKTLEQYEYDKRVKAMQDEQAAAAGKVADQTAKSADNAQQLANNAQQVDSNLKGAVKDASTLSDEMAEAAKNAEGIQPGGGPQDAAIGGGGGGGGKGLLGKAKGLLGKAGGMLGLGGGGGLMGAASGFLNSDLGGMVKEKGIEMAMGSIMGVGDLAINPNGGPVVASPREGGIYQGTKNDGVSMSPSHGGGGGSAPAIDYNALGAAVAAAIAANPPVVHMDGAKVSQSVTATQSRNKGL